MTRSGIKVGYAPFVLAPTRLGEHRIAVVMPPQTWQAYNFQDVDGNGYGDTWYAGPPNGAVNLLDPNYKTPRSLQFRP